MTDSRQSPTRRFVISRSPVQVRQVAPQAAPHQGGGSLSTVLEPERPFVALAPSANAKPVLPHLPSCRASEIDDAWTELSGDESALVVHASAWRWGGPGAGEVLGSLTLRRWGEGCAWDLVVAVTIDPDEPERAHLDLVVRLSDEVRLAEGLPPLGQWWAPTSVLRLHERAAIDAVAQEAVDDPPARRTFAPADVDLVPLRLDAGSLGTIEGELRIVASLGLAYVRATRCGLLTADAAARALRAAVVDGRLAVPHAIRVHLERGGDLLALEGGDL